MFIKHSIWSHFVAVTLDIFDMGAYGDSIRNQPVVDIGGIGSFWDFCIGFISQPGCHLVEAPKTVGFMGNVGFKWNTGNTHFQSSTVIHTICF